MKPVHNKNYGIKMTVHQKIENIEMEQVAELKMQQTCTMGH
jgi:hypothetical protein